MEALREFIRRDGLNCELMIAHYHERKPCVWKVNLDIGIATKVTSHFAAIGCGSNLGEYLLSEHSDKEMESQLGSAVAVHAVETVKKHDAFCGGPTRVALIAQTDSEVVSFYGESIIIFDQEVVTDFAKAISEIDDTSKQERTKRVLENLRGLAERWRERLREKYQ